MEFKWCVLNFVLVAVCGARVGDNNEDNPSPMYDTIIVGMGAAGATAANTLASAGKRVLALEAQDRVGGRVNTVPFGDGVVELGAEWIHGQFPSRVYDLAVKNNVSVIPQDMSMDVFRSDGSKGDKALVNELIDFAMTVVEDPPSIAMPMGDYITSRLTEYLKDKYPDLLKDKDFMTEFLSFLDLVIDNYDATTNWNDLSTDSNYKTLEGDQHISWHRNGYKTLFEILLNKYNNGTGLPTLEYKLNTEVTQIKWPQTPSDSVTVTCKDGGVYTADSVIVTVSVGVLKEIHTTLFSPALPQNKQDAIKHLHMGLLGKIILQFDQKWWPNVSWFGFLWKAEDLRSVKDNWTAKIVGASRSMGANDVLVIWMCGDAGRLVETLPDDVVKTKIMELIRRFMGANVVIPEPISMVRTSWHTNPFTRGSYTYDHVTSPQYPTARADLAEPLTDLAGRPRVMFAGEATDPTHYSTVHGACDSGHREAMRILPNSKI